MLKQKKYKHTEGHYVIFFSRKTGMTSKKDDKQVFQHQVHLEVSK